jgi:glycosyltransferase involved in cell wall biosynthesis
MPLSVLYDYQIFCWQKYGGISRYFYELANRVAGIEQTRVEIFAPLYINDYFDYGGQVRPRGVKIPQLAHTGTAVGLLNEGLTRLKIKPRNDIDIFHETYYSARNNCPKSAKHIVTVHDLIHEKFSNAELKRDKGGYLKAVAARRANHVICVSESTKRDLIELLNVPEEKISVVYHGGSLALSQRRFDKPTLERPYLLYVGLRGIYKNFTGLLRAYAASPQLKNQFAIVCFGGGSLSPEENALIGSLGIQPGCIVQVSGNDDALAQWYTHASAFVFPSLYEGFGIPALEAMAFGCPVACSNTSSLPEVVGEAAELFDPGDSEAMRTAIENVVLSEARSRQLTELGRLQRQKFSWDKCAQDTFAVYKKVLHG